MDTFASLIESLGGAAKLADFTGEKPGTVQQRKARNNFPPETWHSLIAWAHSLGRADVDEAFLVRVATASKAMKRQPDAPQPSQAA